ncbi:MAG: Uma2 family endonuclease [Planctomycetota bacterium]|nr:Uma2 family endonuclease [Planctomycetaceae bacterium]MDQ3332310.1 Uma2 family endonuclease [Planctomycetota bacterium]
MATDVTKSTSTDFNAVTLLRDGARMDRKTFHRLYEQTPEGFKAELIGGVVYVASPLKVPHGRHHAILMAWLGAYWGVTPDSDLLDNTTAILGDESEPQPDAALRIEGGSSHIDEDDYLTGPPELVAEVADSTVRLDLGAKRNDYEREGVAEYLVFVVPERRIVWFVRDEHQSFVELAPDQDGLLKSRVFPGLWLEPIAFFDRDRRKVLDVVKRGTASPEHAAFVESLALKRD